MFPSTKDVKSTRCVQIKDFGKRGLPAPEDCDPQAFHNRASFAPLGANEIKCLRV
jgi:hypothetical protein